MFPHRICPENLHCPCDQQAISYFLNAGPSNLSFILEEGRSIDWELKIPQYRSHPQRGINRSNRRSNFSENNPSSFSPGWIAAWCRRGRLRRISSRLITILLLRRKQLTETEHCTFGWCCSLWGSERTDRYIQNGSDSYIGGVGSLHSSPVFLLPEIPMVEIFIS